MEKLHKIIVYFLYSLLFISFSSNSEVIKLDEDLNSKIYIDTSSVKKIENKIKITSINDFIETQCADGNKFLSIKAILEFDCSSGKHRILYTSIHTEHMAANKPLREGKNPSISLKDVALSWAGKVSEYACSKKTRRNP